MPIAAAYHGAGGAGLYPHWEHFTEKMTCRTDRGTVREARRSTACYAASDVMLASCFVPTLLWCSALRSQSFLSFAQENFHVEGQRDDKMESLLAPGAHCEDIEFNLSSVCTAFLNLAVMRAQVFTSTRSDCPDVTGAFMEQWYTPVRIILDDTPHTINCEDCAYPGVLTFRPVHV